jgi:hypothetical protein
LETFQLGGRTVTSVEALHRFFAALNAQPNVSVPARRTSQDDAVEAQLAARGI